MRRTLEEALRRFAKEQAGRRLLLGVSGGADSVALTLALAALAPRHRLRLTLAHLDHQLRGADAAADVRFVRALARRLKLPCVVGRTAVRALARRRKISLEMAARAARYRFFAATARRRQAAAVVVAHTADDQAETVLLRLVRGAGAQGLGGMAAASERDGLRILRPLLEVSRAEVEAYLKRRGESWREDASNAAPDFLRNRVRHEVLPLLAARLNPQVRAALCHAAAILRDEHAWLETLTRELGGRCGTPGRPDRLQVVALQACPPAAQRRILRQWLCARGVAPEALDFAAILAVERLIRAAAGSRACTLPGGWRVLRRYGELVLTAADAAPDAASGMKVDRPLRVPGLTRVPELGVRVRTRRGCGIVRPRASRLGVWPAEASLCAAALAGRPPLRLRAWRPGDRLAAWGLRGSKKLQDIFVDAKIPRELRGRLPVVVSGEEVVWLPGYRIARAWAVPDERAPALLLTIENETEKRFTTKNTKFTKGENS